MTDSIWKKVKFFVSGHDPEDEYEYEDEDEVEKSLDVIDFNSTEEISQDIITEGYKRPQRSHLVDINNSNHMKVIVYKPKKYSDAEQIVTNLKAKKPVVVNLEDIDVELARKIFNFCSGAICALDGEMRKISKEIFILAPNNVTLDAEKEEDEQEKTFDWRRD